MNKEEKKILKELKQQAKSMPPIVGKTIWAMQHKATLKRLEAAGEKK